MVFKKNVLIVCFFAIICSASAGLLDLISQRLETGPRTNSKRSRELTMQNVKSPAIKLIENQNYSAESHDVVTEDGYILTVHRIANPGKPVVLFQHGLLGTSDLFLIQGAGKDLAFIMHDNGFDVWLTNIRGNYYSRRHVTLDPDRDKQFWEFSFHEAGYYDMPATIDYILNKTNEKNLQYIGHSMGGTIFFVLCSTRPEYNSKISLFHGLAPAVYIVKKNKPVMQLIISSTPQFVKTCEKENIYELLPRKKLTRRLGRALCVETAPTQPLCLAGLFLIMGVDYQQMNASLLPLLFEYYPSGASLYTFYHFYQNAKMGNFRYYDYGEEENIIRYKRKDPPSYNFKKITVPISIYYGDGDSIVQKADCEKLASNLPNVLGVFKVPFPFFNHLDFLFGTDSKKLLYDGLLAISKKYTRIS